MHGMQTFGYAGNAVSGRMECMDEKRHHQQFHKKEESNGRFDLKKTHKTTTKPGSGCHPKLFSFHRLHDEACL